MKLRIVSWEVRPVIMVDDGENLTPLSVNPLSILAADWAKFKNGGDIEAISSLQDQVRSQSLETK